MHLLLVHGEIVRYGEEITSGEYNQLDGNVHIRIRTSDNSDLIRITNEENDFAWSLTPGNNDNYTYHLRKRLQNCRKELYSWQKATPNDINRGLVGYDVLNNIQHFKPNRNPYIFLNNNNGFS
ncbi:hypothetical protein Glove_153g18 [Diversispora epigaea]|uniref:Uncharacterized protein n=1 Tax=Diversispora epigaea TaxID=1348612 RepID=A0A397J1K4_9GLOM|nr:hypothetical protein Glove_153g18 [Diversispora epigaea]